MNKSCLLLAVCMLAACGKTTPADTVNWLVAHPDRLHNIERQCANDDPKMSMAECNAASEARRRLFMGNGSKYAPPKKSPKF